MPLTTSINVSITAHNTKTLEHRTAEDRIPLSLIATLADGTGAGKNSKVFYDERTLADGGTEDIDLAGALTDGFGATVSFAKIRLMVIKAAAANTTALTVGGDAAAVIGFLVDPSDKFVVSAAGGFVMAYNPTAAGYAVTGTTADILQVANGAGAGATYEILICGE